MFAVVLLSARIFLLLVRPSPPSNFRIIRPVNHDAMLVGWTLPEMDEFGRSNGLAVKGYKASLNASYAMISFFLSSLLENCLIVICFIFFRSMRAMTSNWTSEALIWLRYETTYCIKIILNYVIKQAKFRTYRKVCHLCELISFFQRSGGWASAWGIKNKITFRIPNDKVHRNYRGIVLLLLFSSL